jgi:hypothetical protein
MEGPQNIPQALARSCAVLALVAGLVLSLALAAGAAVLLIAR